MSMLLAALLLFTADSSPKHDDTIVFVGDSITQAGDYVAQFEAYMLQISRTPVRAGERAPYQNVHIANVGKSSETVSGTSEPDHHPPRPCIHDRFARDVAAFNPSIIVACYGMNDGNYFPFDEARFERYKAGMNRFIERAFKETPARLLVLLTPPPFDASRALTPPADGKNFGYKNPARDYDQTLRKYADWLLTLRSDRVLVIDVHKAATQHLLRMRQRDKLYSVAPDAVHPTPAGHWIMAKSLLDALRVVPVERRYLFEVNASRDVDFLRSRERENSIGGKEFTRPHGFPLPLRLDPRVSRAVYDDTASYVQTLQVRGIPPGKYWVSLGPHDGLMGYADAAQLGKGMLVADLNKARIAHHTWFEVLLRRRQAITQIWLDAVRTARFDDLTATVNAVARAESSDRVRSLERSAEQLFSPGKVTKISIRPSD